MEIFLEVRTTSGLAYKMAGRVGDSPVIGSGLFIDNEIGGATATGMGEEVLKTVGSFLIVELMRQGNSPQEACEEAIRRIVVKNSNFENFQVGYIAINKKGVKLVIIQFTSILVFLFMKIKHVRITYQIFTIKIDVFLLYILFT